MNKSKRTDRRVRDTYLALVHEFPLRPVKSDREYDAAVVVMNRLAARAEDTLDVGEQDYLDAIPVFVSAYDDEHHVVDQAGVAPLDLLKHLMEANDMTQAELSKVMGVSPSAASMILSGERSIPKAAAKRLGERFRIDTGCFI